MPRGITSASLKAILHGPFYNNNRPADRNHRSLIARGELSSRAKLFVQEIAVAVAPMNLTRANSETRFARISIVEFRRVLFIPQSREQMHSARFSARPAERILKSDGVIAAFTRARPGAPDRRNRAG